MLPRQALFLLILPLLMLLLQVLTFSNAASFNAISSDAPPSGIRPVWFFPLRQLARLMLPLASFPNGHQMDVSCVRLVSVAECPFVSRCPCFMGGVLMPVGVLIIPGIFSILRSRKGIKIR